MAFLPADTGARAVEGSSAARRVRVKLERRARNWLCLGSDKGAFPDSRAKWSGTACIWDQSHEPEFQTVARKAICLDADQLQAPRSGLSGKYKIKARIEFSDSKVRCESRRHGVNFVNLLTSPKRICALTRRRANHTEVVNVSRKLRGQAYCLWWNVFLWCRE